MVLKQAKTIIVVLMVLLHLTFTIAVNADPQADLAPAPPMGWNSFDSYGVNQDRQGPLELYNLSTDLGERVNVADRNPDVVTRIKQIMEKAHEPSAVFNFE